MSRDERWQLSSSAATFYERYVGLIMAPWVRCLVDVAMLQPDEDVLDVACGTGFVARLAAQRVAATGRVVGTDLHSSMIEAARAASERDAVDWRIGDAAALPLENGGFDVVLCQQGLQFFPEHCGRCVEFFVSAVGWPSRCGAQSATHPTRQPSRRRWRDT